MLAPSMPGHARAMRHKVQFLRTWRTARGGPAPFRVSRCVAAGPARRRPIAQHVPLRHQIGNAPLPAVVVKRQGRQRIGRRTSHERPAGLSERPHKLPADGDTGEPRQVGPGPRDSVGPIVVYRALGRIQTGGPGWYRARSSRGRHMSVGSEMDGPCGRNDSRKGACRQPSSRRAPCLQIGWPSARDAAHPRKGRPAPTGQTLAIFLTAIPGAVNP